MEMKALKVNSSRILKKINQFTAIYYRRKEAENRIILSKDNYLVSNQKLALKQI